jgi:hypothetical protein
MFKMSNNMTSGCTKPGVAIAVVIAAAALLLFVNNSQTILAQPKSSPPTDSITITVNLQTHENEFLTNQGYFQVNTLDMNATKGSKLCPSGDCQYSIENAQFGPPPNIVFQLLPCHCPLQTNQANNHLFSNTGNISYYSF